jgi:acyl-CoA reductase-like NAD-dependent aldehyde dehydrogenase
MEIDWIGRLKTVKPQVRNFINGRWQAGSGTEKLEKISPRDGQLLCEFGAGDEKEVDEVVALARQSFEDGRWSKLPVQRRKDVLHKLADLIERHREDLALQESLDVGKPISNALSFDIPMAAETIRFSAEAADKFYGRVYGADPTNLSYQLRRPIGVVAGITAWNFPFLIAAAKVGPALATGNSLILKPSELTSLTSARMAQLAVDAGVPEGVFNVIHGVGRIGAALARHRDVDLISFTGSTQTGKKLFTAAGESNMKRLVLECGGKAPNIVFEDAPNLEGVADAVLGRAFMNQGEVCTASSRLLVHQSIKPEFMAIVAKKAAAFHPGDPLDPATRFGALVSRGHRDNVQGYIDGALKDGTKIAYQSSSPAPFEGGFYVPPIIFDSVSPEQRIAKEEIFGPVLSVITFKDEEEAIRIANDTIYGLSAILWTQNMGRAHRMSQGIKAGWIVVNATDKPLGGPAHALSIGGHKQSGIGVEGGIAGLEEYTSSTAVQYYV